MIRPLVRIKFDEVWRPIAGDWCRAYEVSSYGCVRATDFHQHIHGGRPRQPGLIKPANSIGYNRVGLTRSSGIKFMVKVSRLVAGTFVINDAPATKIEVDHLDNIRANDYFLNLEWVTEAEQQRRRAARLRLAGKTSSSYIGITWHARDLRWYAQLWIRDQRIHIGGFTEELAAAQAYDAYVVAHGLSNPINGLL